MCVGMLRLGSHMHSGPPKKLKRLLLCNHIDESVGVCIDREKGLETAHLHRSITHYDFFCNYEQFFFFFPFPKVFRKVSRQFLELQILTDLRLWPNPMTQLTVYQKSSLDLHWFLRAFCPWSSKI